MVFIIVALSYHVAGFYLHLRRYFSFCCKVHSGESKRLQLPRDIYFQAIVDDGDSDDSFWGDDSESESSSSDEDYDDDNIAAKFLKK